jgi:peptide/histidine transporter 3/4
VQWLPNDLNLGRLDLFFLFMMALMALNTVAFLVVAINYEYKAVEHPNKHPAQVQQPGQGPRALPGAAQQHPSAAVSIRMNRGLNSQGELAGDMDEDMGEAPDLDIYARSLAYLPDTPVMPAPYR